MIYTRKFMFLILVIGLFGFCFNSFAQEKVKEGLGLMKLSPCRDCPKSSHPHMLYGEDFESGTYSIDAPCPPPQSEPPNPVYLPGPFNGQHNVYTITTDSNQFNPDWWCLRIDHTIGTGSGHFLLCDSSISDKTYLFRKNIPVVKGRTYIFCAWFANVVCKDQNLTDPKFQMRINNDTNDPILTLSEGSPWTLKFRQWTSDINGYVPVEIVNLSDPETGHDVALDDISFWECVSEELPCCECGYWEKVNVNWCAPNISDFSASINCGNSICVCEVCQCCPIKLTFRYICTPNNRQCFVRYTWTISGPNGYSLSGSSSGPLCIIDNFIPTVAGLYGITVTPTCGNSKCNCDPCKIEINVREIVQCSSDWPNPCPCFHPGLPKE
jgi:hypothetical protein